MRSLVGTFLIFARSDSFWRFYLGLAAGALFAALCWGAAWAASAGIPLSFSDRVITSWYHIKIDAAKHASQTGAKILIAGGSNVLYGISAEQIEKETGVPTVNFGTHVALGLDYLLWRTSSAIKPGDAVILSLEWEHFHRQPFAVDEVSSPYLVGSEPDYLRRLPWRQTVQMIMASGWDRILLPGRISKNESSRIQWAYDQAVGALWLNALGDIKLNRPQEKGDVQRRTLDQIVRTRDLQIAPTRGLVWIAESSLKNPIWKRIAGFIRSCQKKNIAVWVAFPSVMDYPAYRSTEAKKVYQDFENNFRMLGAGILTHQEETLYPKDFFFDSVYHLQSEARAKRTGLIISRLKENRALPAPGCAP